MSNAYFELIRTWVKESRDEHANEYGQHPCAPHEGKHGDECPESCTCGHTCWDHVFLDGTNLYGPKPTAYICVAPGCSCTMFVDKDPG
jgi:hypothetical protein